MFRNVKASVPVLVLILVVVSTLAAPAEGAPTGNPDLRPESPSVSPSLSSYQPGSSLTIGVYVKNIGSVQAPTWSVMDYYLSDDSTFDPQEDTHLGYDNIARLYPGQRQAMSDYVTLPNSLAAGTWYFLFVADADDEIDESNEGNNVTSRSITVGSGGTSLSVSISGPQYIQRFQSRLYTANVSGGSAPFTYSWEIRFRQSGSWTSWSSTGGNSSSLYASVSSCGIDAFQLKVTVGDSGGDEGSSTKSVFITNPC